MPSWITEYANWWLVALFTAHFLPFVFLSIRRKTWRYSSTVLTFLFLIMLNLFEALGLHQNMEALSSRMVLRTLAIVCATITVVLFVRRRVQNSAALR